MILRRWVPFLAAGCLLTGAAVEAADKLSKEDKQWLDQVRPIMLPDEEKTFKELKEKSDRQEFQKIFWARRDPDLATPENEYQVEYDKLRATADERYKSGGKAGSATDCGRAFILLGEPDDVARGEASRQTWTFKDRNGIKFTGGQMALEFEAGCMLPQGVRLAEQFARLAEERVTQPNLRYPMNAQGRLTPLADQLPKPTPGQALVKAPRQDFPAGIHSSMFLRSPGGATYMAGLFRGDASAGLTPEDVAGKKSARVQVVVQAVDATGRVNSAPDRESFVDYQPDGSFIVSYGMALRPGKYTLTVAVLDTRNSRGSAITAPLDMPDFAVGELTTSQMMALAEIREGQAAATDPYSAFTLGTTQFIPRFDNVFTGAESVTLLAALYNAQTDATSGKPNMTASFKIAKDGKTIAQAEPQAFDTDTATPSVGPVPLGPLVAKSKPGKYVATMSVKDNVSGKDLTRDVAFEIR